MTKEKQSSPGSPKKKITPRRYSSRDKRIEELRQYVRTDGRKYLEDENITSIGIGYKIKDGERTKKLCIQFTVKTKPEEGVGLEGLETEMIPESIEVAGKGIPTDVIQREYKLSFRRANTEQLNARKRRSDPLVAGISVSHPTGTAGTLGVFVVDNVSGTLCMLSNWHVLHRHEGKIGDIIVQPGPFDDNDVGNNRVGKLLRSHLGEAGDCAIATVENRDMSRQILDLQTHPEEVVRVDLDDRVIKSGRTTEVTLGVVRRIDVISQINYEGVGPVNIGCFEIGPEAGAPFDFEISMGGDSGSAWLIAGDDGGSTEFLAGLHFAGETGDNPDEHALACYAHSVFKKLDIGLQPIPHLDLERIAIGFDTQFLSTEVPMPQLTPTQEQDTSQFEGSTIIPYVHFSVCLTISRGLARFVAWNVDGAKLRKVKSRGFRRDSRIPDGHQHGNELYKSNPLDRGHIARRADLAWGSELEAKQANDDSFFYTNIAPQHEAFNRSNKAGLWGQLENAIFDDVDVEDLKISVIAGPIFGVDDQEHRNVKIPQQFWKLIGYKDTSDNTFKIKAYILTQRDLLTDLEVLELDPFRLFQVSIDKLEEETGMDFSSLTSFDTLTSDSEAEAILSGFIREVTGPEDLLS